MSENKSSFHVEPGQPNNDVPRGTERINLTKCPLCSSTKLTSSLTCKDYTSTGESFSLNLCSGCGFVFTNPQPEAEYLGRYYISEDYISHSETRSGLINKIYHLVQSWNLKYKFSICSRYAPSGNWIDYGSGAGAYLKYVSDQNQKIIGYEPDPVAREASKLKKQEVYSIRDYKIFDTKVACISMWHVLEHIPNFMEVLQMHTTNLSVGGVLIVAVPNHLSYDSKYYKEAWAAYDVPRHLWHFSEKDMKQIAESFNLTLDHIRPLIFDAFYVSMLSEKNRQGSIVKGAFFGMLSNLKAWTKRSPYSSQIYVLRKKAV